MKNYIRFGAMILTSTIIMYFLMFVNVYEVAHIHFSLTRLYMAILMGAVMAIIMLLYMWKMYENKKINYLILLVSVSLFGLSFGLIQNQVAVDDVAWMKAMIPHHSTAILTSKNANITDSRTQKLANEIITAQEKEIAEMESLIKELEDEN